MHRYHELLHCYHASEICTCFSAFPFPSLLRQAIANLQALQYKTQATQAQLKAQQEAEARKRIEAEAARAVAARMTEKPRVSSFSLGLPALNAEVALHQSGCSVCCMKMLLYF